MNRTYQNGLISLALLAAMVAAFFMLFEKVEETTQTAGSAEARKNPFLAAERFLSASGVTARSINHRDILINLPPADSLIFVNHLGGNLPREREDRLIAWIENGGTLVLTHNHRWKERLEKSGNTLMDRIGIRLHTAEDMETATPRGSPDENTATTVDDQNTGDNPEAGATPCESKTSETVRFPVHGETGKIEFLARYVLEDAGDRHSGTYAGDTGIHIITRKMGAGRLVVLSDNLFLRNTRIGDNDHAFFLAGMAEDCSNAWILYNTLMPSFFAILLKKAPHAVFAMTLLAVAYICWLTRRVGPRYQLPDHSSRNITEHLLSAGHFIRKQGQAGTLIKAARNALRNKVPVPHRGRDTATTQQILETIATQTGLPEAEVTFALTGHMDSAASLVNATAILQEIDEALQQKHSNPKP